MCVGLACEGRLLRAAAVLLIAVGFATVFVAAQPEEQEKLLQAYIQAGEFAPAMDSGPSSARSETPRRLAEPDCPGPGSGRGPRGFSPIRL